MQQNAYMEFVCTKGDWQPHFQNMCLTHTHTLRRVRHRLNVVCEHVLRNPPAEEKMWLRWSRSQQHSRKCKEILNWVRLSVNRQRFLTHTYTSAMFSCLHESCCWFKTWTNNKRAHIWVNFEDDARVMWTQNDFVLHLLSGLKLKSLSRNTWSTPCLNVQTP